MGNTLKRSFTSSGLFNNVLGSPSMKMQAQMAKNPASKNIYVPDKEARRRLVTPMTAALVQQVDHKFKKGVRFYGEDGKRILPADQ